MKNLLLLLFLSVSIHGFSQNDEYSNYGEETTKLNWLTDFEAAKKEAAASKKPLLMYFTGSDWCAPCKMLKEDFFNTDAFEEKAKHFVLLMVDMPRRLDIITPEQRLKNKVLVKKYNRKGSYPNIVALNSNLRVLGELSGYTFLRETERHFSFIEGLIKNN